MSRISILCTVLITYTSAVTQHGVRLALAEVDSENLRREDTVPIHEDIPPSMLITSGLEYETQQ